MLLKSEYGATVFSLSQYRVAIWGIRHSGLIIVVHYENGGHIILSGQTLMIVGGRVLFDTFDTPTSTLFIFGFKLEVRALFRWHGLQTLLGRETELLVELDVLREEIDEAVHR